MPSEIFLNSHPLVLSSAIVSSLGVGLAQPILSEAISSIQETRIGDFCWCNVKFTCLKGELLRYILLMEPESNVSSARLRAGASRLVSNSPLE